MVKAYFNLQLELTKRKCQDAGIHPWLAYPLLLLLFSGFSFYLFYKTEYAAYIYILAALAITGKLSEIKRNDFLKICFGKTRAKQIRMAENLLVVFPFIAILLYKQLFLFALVLFIVSALLALVHFRTVVNITIPTPFYKRPFEFIVGFRNTFYVILGAYALTGIAIVVGNFNLGVFSLLLVFGTALTYYMKPELPYYVWIFGMSAREFLVTKIRTAILHVSYIGIPIVLMLFIFFPQHIAISLAFFLLGLAYLVCTIVSKYSAYPDELSISQGIMLALCIWLPPLLIIMIPFLFRKSQHRLRMLLP